MIDQWFQGGANILILFLGLMLQFWWIDLLLTHILFWRKKRKVRKMLEEVTRGGVR